MIIRSVSLANMTETPLKTFAPSSSKFEWSSYGNYPEMGNLRYDVSRMQYGPSKSRYFSVEVNGGDKWW